ncbi:MAG: glucose-6-phosphate isomerase, partial [Octadecabacter sp.]
MWDKLRAHSETVKDRRFETLVDAAGRADDFTASVGDLRLDYAKTNIDADGRALLIDLLDQVDLAGKRDAMFSGAAINETEGRAVLHTALRNLDGGPVMVDGVDVMPEVLATLDRMDAFAADVRSGA